MRPCQGRDASSILATRTKFVQAYLQSLGQKQLFTSGEAVFVYIVVSFCWGFLHKIFIFSQIDCG
jgi:hypothetical protein